MFYGLSWSECPLLCGVYRQNYRLINPCNIWALGNNAAVRCQITKSIRFSHLFCFIYYISDNADQYQDVSDKGPICVFCGSCLTFNLIN